MPQCFIEAPGIRDQNRTTRSMRATDSSCIISREKLSAFLEFGIGDLRWRRFLESVSLVPKLERAEIEDHESTRLVKFGEIEVEGKRYTHDVVIDGGKVRRRKKGPSK